jgi:hypothetical protein
MHGSMSAAGGNQASRASTRRTAQAPPADPTATALEETLASRRCGSAKPSGRMSPRGGGARPRRTCGVMTAAAPLVSVSAWSSDRYEDGLTDASANRLPGQHFADDEHHYFLGGGQRLPSGGRQVRERPGRAYPAKEPCVGPRGPVRRVFLRCGENYYQHRRPAPAARCWQCRWRNFAAAAEALTSSESVSTPSKRPREASPPSKHRRHVPRRTQRATLDEIAPA